MVLCIIHVILYRFLPLLLLILTGGLRVSFTGKCVAATRVRVHLMSVSPITNMFFDRLLRNRQQSASLNVVSAVDTSVIQQNIKQYYAIFIVISMLY